ncbi:hypothetical protein PTTG_29396, partial [Puccinia triticina 1-1 BBBD Race 1]
MTRSRKRPRQTSILPTSSPPGPSDGQAKAMQSNVVNTDLLVPNDDASDTTTSSPIKASRTSQPSTVRELTDNEELVQAQKIASMGISTAYSSYHKPELSAQLDKKGRRMIAYPCKTCSTKIHRPTYDSSCSNLLKHAAGCLKKLRESTSNQNLAGHGGFGTGDIDSEEVNQLCAIWCAEAARPFAALADESQKAILHPKVVKNMPLAKVVLRSIHMLYTAVQDSAMYLGADAWQSPNGQDILGIIIYRLVEKDGGKFELESMPLDFVRLARSHTGEYLAKTMRLVVEKFDVQDKWIRCFAHILNLIVQSILQPFKKVQNKMAGNQGSDLDSDEESEYEDAENQIRRLGKGSICEEHDPAKGNLADSDNLEEFICNNGDEEEDNDLYTLVSCKQTLNKFCSISRKLRKSPNSKAEFIKLCAEMQCSKPHNIPRDVRTQWNSTFSQLEAIIQCEKAIFVWQKDRKFGLSWRYHIEEVDIHLACDLVVILQIFHEQTLQISVSGSAQLTHIIVFIDEITEHLSSVIKGNNDKYPPVLRNAFLCLTRDMFNTFYKPPLNSLLSSQSTKSSKPKTGHIAQLALAAQLGQSSNDPLAIWLSSGLILDDGSPINALKWWIQQKRAGNTHGGLVQMALNVLSFP